MLARKNCRDLDNKLANYLMRTANLRYHVPRSWLKPSGNLLVVFEEWGGDPTKISLVSRKVVTKDAEDQWASATLLSD